MPEERLQKILARAGLGSRRACEQLISQGRVTLDGQVVTELGARADPEVAEIRVDGEPVSGERLRYVMLHKPAGYLSSPDPRAGYPSWRDLVPVQERLFPAGRLDLNSEGLLLLTNDGELVQHLTHPRFEHPKAYLVQVEGIPDARKIRRLEHGIMLDDGPTAPAEVTLLRRLPPEWRGVASGPAGAPASADGKRQATAWLMVTLREGRKRQLRRMVGRLGHPALRVIRVGLGPLSLGNLRRGQWRDLTPQEVEALRRAARAGAPPVRKAGAAPAVKPEAPPLPAIIAIDGPSASGKSTVGRLVARELGYLYFDTGVMYRAIALLALQRGVPVEDEAAVAALAAEVHLEVLPATVPDGRDVTVLANGVDITWEIRRPDVERAVSPVSAYPGVREVLRAQQRRIGLAGRVVMVGRDIGTVVLPEAELKLYLDAALRERAHRRYLQRVERGESPDLEEVLADIRRRDALDSSREHAPLAAAPDAIVVDTTDLTIPQVIERVLALVRGWGQRRSGPSGGGDSLAGSRRAGEAGVRAARHPTAARRDRR